MRKILKKSSLKIKWLLSTFVFILSFSLILVSFFINSGQKDLENELQKWVISLVTNLAYNSELAVQEKDHRTLQNYLVGIMIQGDILYGAILDQKGALLALVDPNWMFNTRMHYLLTRANDHRVKKFQNQDGSSYLNISWPIEMHTSFHESKNERNQKTELAASSVSKSLATPNITAAKTSLGTVILGISFNSMNKKLDRMRNKALYLALIIGLICVSFVLWGVERVSAPIKQLADATAKIAHGDLNHIIENDRKDELGRLAKSFNDMTLKLRESDEKVKFYTRNLEQQVDEKTRQFKTSEKKYRTLFEHSGTAFALVDEDEKLVMVNKEFETLCGYSRAEIESTMNVHNFISPEDSQKIKKYFERRKMVHTAINPLNDEWEFNDRYGNQKNVNISMSVMPDTNNILLSLTDVTQLRKLQDKLNRSHHLAAIGELSAAISHEIRNSLVAIYTSIDVLKSGLNLAGDDRELVEIICQESERLNRIIDDFIRFARPSKPKLHGTNINHLIQQTLILLRDKIGNGIRQQILLDENIPILQIDPDQIKQVLLNIIINAIEAMSSGGTLTVATQQVNHETGNGSVRIDFVDTGMGITEPDLGKIFQPFYSNKEYGAGMGLAICERIIQNHEGEIKVESSPGKGSRFTIILPLNHHKS